MRKVIYIPYEEAKKRGCLAWGIEITNEGEIMNKYYYLIDSDGGEHEFYGTLEGAKAAALERGYDVDFILNEEGEEVQS